VGEFEIGSGEQLSGSLQINSPSQPALAGETVEISGAGFAANPRENNVQIAVEDGAMTNPEVLAVSNDSIRIRTLFGAGTGKLKILRGQFEASADILFLSGATLYAGTDGGVFRSTDDGSSWTPINGGLTYLRAASFTLANGALYAGHGRRRSISPESG
jgi:hypothetical protein